MDLKPIDVLRQYWGYDSFRPVQEDIINSVLAGTPTLALLPTGGGKSICFQVPGLLLKGVCLVISPLISLMRDQVSQLQNRGVKAKALYAGMSRQQLDITLDNCIYGDVRFLYVSPERLKSTLFLERASKMNFSMIAVDEAHCISQWGYDFRPSYLEIGDFVERFGISKIVALTATATSKVRQDIISRLGMAWAETFTKSFARKNLSYSVFQLEKKEEKLMMVLQRVPGSGIVYTRSRKSAQEVAAYLRANHVSADFYHAGLAPAERERRQDEWIQGKVRVMVATNAFGMGIDKGDVRVVVHMDLPDSLEAYYQEAGRAGRDEQKAYATMLWSEADGDALLNRIELSFPPVEEIRRTYQGLANYYKLAVGSVVERSYDFDINHFCQTFNFDVYPTFCSLKKLEEAGLILLSESFFRQSELSFVISKEEIYSFQVQHPNLERVIKGLLRLYGGELFADYIRLSELDLSKLLNTTIAQVQKWLRLLDKYEVLDYREPSNKEQITFLTARFPTDSLPVDMKKLQSRKETVLGKARSMVDFARSQETCRTRLIQGYFDEISDQDCGVCDYCVARKRRGQQRLKPKVLLDLLRERGASSISELMLTLTVSEKEILDTVRYLVEENQVMLQGEKVLLKAGD